MRGALLILLGGCGRIAFDPRTDGGGNSDAVVDAACMPSTAATALEPARLLPSGRGPYWLSVADMDGDRKPDVIASSNLDNTVDIYLGYGDGGLRVGNGFPVAANPFGIAVADVNGDGTPDVVTANPGGNSASVLINNGDATFVPHVDLPAPGSPRTVVIAQLADNGVAGDTLPDIALTENTNGAIGIFTGTGGGAFSTVSNYPGATHPWAMVVGDLDRNGFNDYITVDTTELAVNVFLSSGLNMFVNNPTSYAAGTSPQALALADLDHDGNLDIVVADGDGSVYVYIGSATGLLTARGSTTVGVNPVALIAADLTGDGIIDVATVNSTEHTTSLLAGNGDGTFQPVEKRPTGTQPYSLAAGDLDGDGRLDLIVGDVSDNTLSVFHGSCVR